MRANWLLPGSDLAGRALYPRLEGAAEGQAALEQEGSRLGCGMNEGCSLLAAATECIIADWRNFTAASSPLGCSRPGFFAGNCYLFTDNLFAGSSSVNILLLHRLPAWVFSGLSFHPACFGSPSRFSCRYLTLLGSLIGTDFSDSCSKRHRHS